MNKRVHLFIYGDVIGVGFRGWTVRQVGRLGLTGWVRNFDYHTVEAVLEGSEKKLEDMIEKCKKGPDVSRVEKVEVEWEKTKGEFEGFTIRY